MRVLALTRYTRLGASSRLRSYQYMPLLREAGIALEPMPFFDDDYIEKLYATGSRPLPGRYYLRRFRTLRGARGYDAIWLEKEALPWLPYVVERRLLPEEVPLIIDYDDAIFHRYDGHRSGAVRALLGGKIDRLMARADLVVAGNRYLAERAEKARARRVEIVPTVVDPRRYYEAPRPRRRDKPRVGWIGSPSTAPYLAGIAAELMPLAAEGLAEFVAIGARADQLAGGPFRPLAWSEEEEAKLLAELDIGIMPLPDSPWERGKCGYKIIQYMASGLPVIASPVGANRDILRDGVSGFFAGDERGWAEILRMLLSDADLRWRMGRAGRERVEARYSLTVQAPRLAGLLRAAAA
ncbi:MAG: glycosyltransferase family 4 protein [Sphingomonadaceae bacterium]